MLNGQAELEKQHFRKKETHVSAACYMNIV